MKETVTTEFGSALSDAFNKKDNIDQLVWKDKGGKEIRLMDMSKNELQKAYDHTTDMLYNTNRYTPGRLQVKKNIKGFIANCNAELLARYILHECNVDILKTNMEIVSFLRDKKAEYNLTNDDSVTTLFTNLPREFETVTIGKLMDACLDQLDVINRKMISDNFLLAQGIWLTEEEKEDLTEYNDDKTRRPWFDVIKERLLLPDVKLRVDPRGFTYSEFRSLIHLDPLPKVSKLPTNTLKLLRDKVFMLLDADVDYHIAKWEALMKGIESVAQYKNIELIKKNYPC